MSMADFMDPVPAKIVLVTKRGDSIHRIAEKIGISYSWVYEWIERLDGRNIISKSDNGIGVVDHELRRRYADMMAALYSRGSVSQEDAYQIPHFAGMEFAYTEIDAVYVWTEGGYQISRSHDDYPVFIEVHDRDVERWRAFFERFGIHSTVEERPDAGEVDGNVHYVLYPNTDGIDVDWVGGNPVVPLDETVAKMRADRAAYEPALEMIAEMYDVEVEARHHRTDPAD